MGTLRFAHPTKLRIHRYSGYTRSLPLERMMRDGRSYAVGSGTVEILRNALAALEFGRRFDQPRGWLAGGALGRGPHPCPNCGLSPVILPSTC